ncbi:MAG: 4-hydroxy-tetrahydrodipicolinate reductase [Actinomycetaceae bacterium]|nr:4-hydroxy-tetrahydrodipicolinate reductase [Actinomycetaceae bacterium]
MLKVAVVGARGRMGQTVCRAVENAEDMQLVAALDQGDTISADTLGGADVVVEFTVPSQTQTNVEAILEAGSHVVVGTTGWDEDALARVRQRTQTTGKNAFIAANFALSAVLAMEFAALAAPWFESVEVIEAHHPNKVDAPSGTAVVTAQKIAAAREKAGKPALPDATETDPQGCRGGKYHGIPVHSLRLRGLTAQETIVLGNSGETMTICTDTTDREAFMPGVLLAVRQVGQKPGLTVGLEKILNLTMGQ